MGDRKRFGMVSSVAAAIMGFTAIGAQAFVGGGQSTSPMVQGENAFGFALLRAVDSHGGNVFVSPLSIGQAMTMLDDGAAGATRAQISQALGVSGMDSDAVNRQSNALGGDLQSADPGVELSIANALWADQHISFLPTYTQTCLSVFGANSSSLDFADPSAAQTINSWVKAHTDGKIDAIVTADSIRRASAVLTDAVYFHGKWRSTFNKGATQEGPFTTASGSTPNLPMMEQTHLFPVLQNDQFQAVKLPYGNGRISMFIVLPRSGQSVDSIAANLSAEQWDSWMSTMAIARVDLTLPRFHVDFSASLVSALKSLGITDAFERHDADFSGMSQTPMFVSDVEHKTTLDVDESGTTATAATAITMMPTMAMPVMGPPIVIRVDHPFLCAIVDNQTGAVLFVGLIRNPQELQQ